PSSGAARRSASAVSGRSSGPSPKLPAPRRAELVRSSEPWNPAWLLQSEAPRSVCHRNGRTSTQRDSAFGNGGRGSCTVSQRKTLAGRDEGSESEIELLWPLGRIKSDGSDLVAHDLEADAEFIVAKGFSPLWSVRSSHRRFGAGERTPADTGV